MKQKLLALVDSGRRKEVETLFPNVDDTEPPVAGQWTTKDVVAHLTSWRRIAIAELDSGRTGSAVPEVDPDDDVQNARFYAETHHLSAHATLDAAARTWDDLEAAIERCTEDDLDGPRPRQPTQKLWQVVPNNTYYHVAEHLGYWYTDLGDDAAAEKAAIWGHDVAVATFAGDRQRGVAEYNLGCFYARRGRKDEALPYLASGFDLRPDLRDFAKQDSDLDPIRSAPEVTSLLAGT
jgi:hypothetical protein